VYVKYVLSFEVVNIAVIRKKAVEEQKAQIGDAGFGKCRQANKIRQLQLRFSTAIGLVRRALAVLFPKGLASDGELF